VSCDWTALRRREYDLRLKVNALRRQLYPGPGLSDSDALQDRLEQAEKELAALELERAQAQADDPSRPGRIVLNAPEGGGEDPYATRGHDTTGLGAEAVLRMAQVPTAFYHLFDRDHHPLVVHTIENVSDRTRRLRITSYIEGYSARAVDTFEVAADATVTLRQLPTLFPRPVARLTELTTATLNISIEDLQGEVELHRTEPVRLLPRTTAPLVVMDPDTGRWQDLSPYLAAYVTPNAPAIMSFLRRIADLHPGGHLDGYGSVDDVRNQVKAVFEALRAAGITYISSTVAFSPEDGPSTQRIRLPRESLKDQAANCIDGTVLFASLLEAMSLNVALVVTRNHAFVA